MHCDCMCQVTPGKLFPRNVAGQRIHRASVSHGKLSLERLKGFHPNCSMRLRLLSQCESTWDLLISHEAWSWDPKGVRSETHLPRGTAIRNLSPFLENPHKAADFVTSSNSTNPISCLLCFFTSI